MEDLSTASAEAIVADALRITAMVSKHRTLSSGVLSEMVMWLCAYIQRLHDDLNGVPHKTHEDVQKEIQQWATMVKYYSRT